MKKVLVTCGLLFSLSGWGQTLPYQNPELSPAERAKDLVKRLTLEEKALLMCDDSEAIPRLGIKKFNWWSEALHGVANQGNVTVFPEPVGMAASFNDKLVFEIFNAVSDEMRAKHNERVRNGLEDVRFHSLSVWTPNVNIFRDPRWGRGQETYGEDPYLTSQMGIAVVKGLQGPENEKYRKLLACAKHYAVHSGPEWSRHTANLNNVSPRDLWETYLPAFKALVQKADVREVMCAYQRLDDDPCCGNTRLLQQILRDEWGFKYLVVSDCGAIADFWTSHKSSSDAVHAAVKGTMAGTDVECGYGYAYQKLPEAVSRGLITEEEVDKHVLRLMEGRFELGEMDDPSLVNWTKIPMSVVNCKAHKDLSLNMSRQTMTLLQNKNNVLPLSKSIRKIAVIGPNADDKPMLWGNYNGTPNQTITILDGFKSKLKKNQIVYMKGCDLVNDQTLESYLDQCSIDGKPGIKATFWNNPERQGEPVSSLRTTQPINVTTYGLHTFGPGVNLEKFSAKYETVLTPKESGEVSFIISADDGSRLFIDGKEVYSDWHDGPAKEQMYRLNAVKGKNYKVVLEYFQAGGEASLKFAIGIKKEINYKEVADKAAEADAIIFVGGLSPTLEGEEMPVDLPGFRKGDRTNIDLPHVQAEMLKALKKTGKPVIFVLCSGSTLALPWEAENLDAILEAWYPGQQGGTAVADVLFGDYNPAGRLPLTFYASSNDLPDFEDYDMSNRTYRYFKGKALFPFGHALSYTIFDYGKAKVDKQNVRAGEGMTLTIPLKNTGKLDGDEVIQVYLRNPADKEGPIKTLRAFRRVSLPAGQTENIRIELPASTFECFNPSTNRMEILPGKYELLYGGTSDEKALQKLTITVKK